MSPPKRKSSRKKPARSAPSGRKWLSSLPLWNEWLAPAMNRLRTVSSAETGSELSHPGAVFDYEIIDEPMEFHPPEYGLSPAEAERIEDVSRQLHQGDPARLVGMLEKLTEEFPQVPKVWNHLGVAYQAAGRRDDYERVAEETLRRFPEYLFGIIQLAMLRIEQNRAAEVPALLHGTFVLHELQQGRMSYHISEVISFFGMLACYFLAVRDGERAAHYLDALEALEPDHPMTQMVRSRMLLRLSEIMLGEDDETGTPG